MKKVTQKFKENITKLGRELDSIITYTLNNEKIELGNSELNSVSRNFETSLLKSVMKELDIDSKVDIPLGTLINYKFGVSFDSETYEYIDYGNYIVYSSEKQEDTNSYNIICYDRMLASMTNYEKLQTDIKTFPMSVRDYIDCICADLGLHFKNINETFVNYNRTISGDLYAELGYTYRDILDELAQVTASNIVINDNDELEIRYITETNDTINESYFKDINVNFGEKYGPINSIVLSRAAESDNVYLRNEASVKENGLCEIKIVDNQIMNFNNRSDYLPEILQKLNGLEFYTNDFTSTGICYYDICDKYNSQIGDQIYTCIMFNDRAKHSNGLEEFIYSDLPEQAETDYEKADKTDRRINQAYRIVDKQNGIIEDYVSKVDGQDEKISQVLQTVDEINSKISQTMDLTVSGETTQGRLELNNVNESEPITIKLRARIENISHLYPYSKLYPSNNTYLNNRIIRFENKKTNEIIEYKLPDDLLYYDVDNYDEFFLSYETQTCQVIKKCKYNADGTVGLLDKTEIIDYPYPQIHLTDGDYIISLPQYNTFYLYVTLMGANIYTTQFATKVELNSSIKQTADAIELEVSKKISNNDGGVELASLIRQTAELIYLQANNFGWKSLFSEMTIDGKLTATGGIIGGWTIGEHSLSCDIIPPYDYSQSDTNRIQQIMLGSINPTSDDYEKYDFNKDGKIDAADLNVCNKLVIYNLKKSNPGKLIFDTSNWFMPIRIINSNGELLAAFGVTGVYTPPNN